SIPSRSRARRHPPVQTKIAWRPPGKVATVPPVRSIFATDSDISRSGKERGIGESSDKGAADGSGLAADTEELGHGVEVAIHHTLLEGNDGVVRDGDVLRANLGAALGDVAVADPPGLLQLVHPIF